jgi:F0F1-type ATP synthase membrane subunit c/vacuolar-type H+-ATPase subunit K
MVVEHHQCHVSGIYGLTRPRQQFHCFKDIAERLCLYLLGKFTAGTISGALCFGIGVSVGAACLLSAIRQGQVCANGIIGVSQGHNVFTNTLMYAALPEFYAILGLVGAIMAH